MDKADWPFWPSQSSAMLSRFSCFLMAGQMYLLKSGSCSSALFSSPFQILTLRLVSRIGVIYNPAGFVNCSAPSTGFQLVVSGNGHKVSGFLQAPLWLLGQPEHLGKSSPWLQIRVACACPNTPGLNVSSLPPQPSIHQKNLNTCKAGCWVCCVPLVGRL